MRSVRHPFHAGTALAAVLIVSACSTTVPEGSDGSSQSSDATRVVTTAQGEVTIPADPQRIIVLNSTLAGYLFALDEPVHGVLSELPGESGEFPAAWAADAEADGTVVVQWGEDGFDFEALLAEAPDLIIAGGQGYPSFLAEESFERLAEVAPTVLVDNQLTTWQDQLSFIAADVLDAADREAGLVAAYDARVAEVAAAIDLPELPVAYLVLSEGIPFVLPEDSALPQTLAELGFEPAPVVQDNPELEAYGTGDSLEMSTEQVSQVFTAPTLFVFGFIDEEIDLDAVGADPVYAGLPAFAAGSVYSLPSWVYRADYLNTLALLDVVEEQFS
ncbi:ABC transporter substrate-binding protein [Occultella kanbiaonis]|uniref:ABC transporter substrate-binding protein n=1 Tax=Occultella kanbiaonis TaxID=2675754 RepID=UPI0013D28A62|nr:ABC transporter substrate-binding protein [Occultella kanbiaonis]